MTAPANQRNGQLHGPAAALLPVLTVLVAACSVPTSTAAPSSPRAEDLAAQLPALQVVAEDTGAHYDRDDWPHWSQLAGGCDTRETVLQEQGRDVSTGRQCRITGGRWISAYDGVSVTDPRKLDLDHVVPLAEVQRSGRVVDGRRVGPRQWTRSQREQYANDRGGLAVVTASSNRAKGDQDPATWLPERDRCGYVARWVEIKQRYELSVDQAEHDAVAGVLAACPNKIRRTS